MYIGIAKRTSPVTTTANDQQTQRARQLFFQSIQTPDRRGSEDETRNEFTKKKTNQTTSIN